MTKIIVNQFAKRQTPDSSYSHFAGSWEELAGLAEQHFPSAKPGYKDGVMLIPVPAERFHSAVLKLDYGTKLVALFEARRPGEEPFINIGAVGSKAPARVVQLVVYRQDILGMDASGEKADYEVISINASPTENEPMTPVAMARNFLGLPGGTKAEYTAEEFARSIDFWSTHAMRA
jgi:hypothetical protein